MAPAAALLLALALRAQAQVDAGVRLEAAVRHGDPPVVAGEGRALDLSALPRLALRVTGGGNSVSAAYTPRFSLLAVGPHARSEQLHEGELRAVMQRGDPFRLEAFASGAAGRTDLVTEGRRGTGTGTGATTTLTTRAIDLERLRTGLALALVPGRRTELLVSGWVAHDGGTTAASREAYPMARSVEAAAAVRWRATRLDRIGLELTANHTRIASRRADSTSGTLLATWRSQLGPATEARAGAGAVVFASRVPDEDGAGRQTLRRMAPAAQLGLTRTETRPLDVTGELAGTLGATVDRTTGRASPGADASASVRWPWSRLVALTGRGAAAFTWPDAGTGRSRTGRLEAALSFALTPRLHLDLGGFGTWQRIDPPTRSRLDSYGASLSLELGAPPLRF